ncbi:uncharacterized protein LOC108477255 isoform X2 [Gossypium arboreum]|uniref:uncharacterized protein LOC108477255 isoform X2 n=1 Tax=Gossypium arboreum TaxID=29729 RepID=UPI0022F17CD2|nr:uncharacterized protein LOC108477255 isoform X2 [Gossypium arboreum]
MGRCCVWELSQGETSTSGSWTTHINPIAETKNPFPMQKQKQRFPQNLFPFVLLHVPLRRGTTRIYPKAKEELYSLSSFISFQSIRLLLIFKMETKLHPFDSVEDNELPSGKLKDLPRGIMHTRSDLELRPQWRKSLRSTDNQITGPWIAQGVLLVGKKVE